jgi:hypothetical protein
MSALFTSGACAFLGRRSRCGARGHSAISPGPESTVPRATQGSGGAELRAATYGLRPAGAADGEGRA